MSAQSAVQTPSGSVALSRSGRTVWLTGLPSAGKTTIAPPWPSACRRRGAVEVLDGDEAVQAICAPTSATAGPTATRTCAASATWPTCCPARRRPCCARWCRPTGRRATRCGRVGRRRPLRRGVGVDAGRGVRRPRREGPLRPPACRRDLGLTGVDDPYEPPLAPRSWCPPTRSTSAASSGSWRCCDDTLTLTDADLAGVSGGSRAPRPRTSSRGRSTRSATPLPHDVADRRRARSTCRHGSRPAIEVVFLDTQYHFPETLDHARGRAQRYP